MKTQLFYVEISYEFVRCMIFIRGVTVDVFVPNFFGTGISVRYECVLNIFFFFQEIQTISAIMTL